MRYKSKRKGVYNNYTTLKCSSNFKLWVSLNPMSELTKDCVVQLSEV